MTLLQHLPLLVLQVWFDGVWKQKTRASDDVAKAATNRHSREMKKRGYLAWRRVEQHVAWRVPWKNKESDQEFYRSVSKLRTGHPLTFHTGLKALSHPAGGTHPGRLDSPPSRRHSPNSKGASHWWEGAGEHRVSFRGRSRTLHVLIFLAQVPVPDDGIKVLKMI